MKLVKNTCYGGFGLSNKAYEKLIEWGIPVKKYTKQVQDEDTGRYNSPSENEGEVIFDRTLTKKEDPMIYFGRYWETWISENREHPLLVRVVEELGAEANGSCANLIVVDIPDGTDYEIDDYDGIETIRETHNTW